jgi:hypothetical protein
MGHRSGLTKSYFKPTDQELLEGNDKALGYVAAINDLSSTREVPASSPTFQSSRSEENHAQFTDDIQGKPGGNVEGRSSSCSPLHDVPSSDTEHETAKVSTVTDFFYDDPNMPYTPLADHDLDHSPCYPIIHMKQGFFTVGSILTYRNVHLESVEHHVKRKDPLTHKSELLKLLNIPKPGHG